MTRPPAVVVDIDLAWSPDPALTSILRSLWWEGHKLVYLASMHPLLRPRAEGMLRKHLGVGFELVVDELPPVDLYWRDVEPAFAAIAAFVPVASEAPWAQTGLRVLRMALLP